jgi:argininosuccinate synthase
VVPLVIGGQLYQDVYPLLVSTATSSSSARWRCATRAAPACSRTAAPAWATTRCASTRRSARSATTTIVAPIRDIQREHTAVRAYEAEYLQARGFAVRAKTARYSINVNLLGVTASGSEIDEFEAPGEETWQMCAHPSRWPRTPLR